jgi:hypothetical protein
MAVNVPNEPSMRGFLPEGLRQSPLEHLGANWSRPGPLAGRNNIFQLAEIFLPDASTAVVNACPMGVIVVGVPLNPFCFQPFHRRLLAGGATMIGHTESRFKLNLKG